MKVKLKEGESLSSNNNWSGLNYNDWLALGAGKEVELDSIPEFVKEQIEEVKATSNKKGGK